MPSPWQAATLVASPSYPNSISWSTENLIAIATHQAITILNPALPVGPRGLITLPADKPFHVGAVKEEDLFSPCLMAACLSRSVRPCARSIEWSEPGFAPNSGCLLAVCTTEGRVKLYRPPYCEFRAEWVEAVDISELLYDYLKRINFQEQMTSSTSSSQALNNAKTITGRCNDGLQDYAPSNIRKCTKPTISSRRDRLSFLCYLPFHHNIVIFGKGCFMTIITGTRQSKLGMKAPYDGVYGAWAVCCITTLFYGNGDVECNEPLVEDVSHDESRDSTNRVVFDNNANLTESMAINRVVGTSKVARPRKKTKVIDVNAKNLTIGNGSLPISEDRLPETKENNVLTLITPWQYASRSALLSSLIVAWSPVIQSSRIRPSFSKRFTILAIGGKSGNISFWKISQPQCYTIEHGRISVDPIIIGLLQAHNSWITALSWGKCIANSPKSQLFLATGSCNGSVKIWVGDIEDLCQLSVESTCFSLLHEVTTATAVPVSILSLVVPVDPKDKLVLAVGRGSGSLEACTYDVSCKKLKSTGVHDAHNQVVTGLAWAFNGRCLYSCSQDNSVHSWILYEDHLHQVSFPSECPGLKDSYDFSQVSDQCFGLAISPSNLMIAVVRSLDTGLLNPMYEARTHKAVVDFLWTGAQSVEISADMNQSGSSRSSDLSEQGLRCWASNILWSLKSLENIDKPLILWDVLAALQAFNTDTPSFLEKLLFEWLSSWLPGYQYENSLENVLFRIQTMLLEINSRKIHLLNIIGRRVMLNVVKSDLHYGQKDDSQQLDNKEQKIDFWNNLVAHNERELRQRLLALTLKFVLSGATSPPNDLSADSKWFPVGVAQMECWVNINDEVVHNQLKVLCSRIRDLGIRIDSICEYNPKETCSFCSNHVSFESPEFAWCEDGGHNGTSKPRHKLQRCAVSMSLCSVATPLWFCICCRRSAAMLAPRAFFSISNDPLDVNHGEDCAWHGCPEALCPFCGIRLQRSLPEFLPSVNPV